MTKSVSDIRLDFICYTYLRTPRCYSSCRTLAASHNLCEVSLQRIFTGWCRQPHAQPSTWRTRVSLLVWHLPRNLSGMGGPASSYAAASMALEFTGAHKPPHAATKCFRRGGYTIHGVVWYTVTLNPLTTSHLSVAYELSFSMDLDRLTFESRSIYI
jgi:hypothetical protein